MSQTKHEIQAILAGAGSEPRHRFGQNFMIDQNLVRLVADAGGIQAGDLVIEVGPGTGTLTDELLARAAALEPAADVVAVEIDRDLAALTRERLAANARFTLIEGDALAGKHAVNEELAAMIKAALAAGRGVRLVANLPYNIASPLVIELLILGVQTLAFVVQKEVGDRLKGKAGTDDYGPLTVVAQLLAEVEVLRKLPPGAFWPPPSVDSALVKMVRRDRLGARATDVSRFVAAVFASRRKTLRKALTQAGYEPDAMIAKLGLDPQCRAEELEPQVFLGMYEELAGEKTKNEKA